MPLSALAQLVLLGAIWGGSFLCMRIAAPEMGVPALITARLLLAAAVLGVLLNAERREQVRRHWKKLALLGVINSLVPFCLLAYATKELSAGLPSIINATVPFWAALLSLAWLGERLSRVGLVGLCVGFGGVVVLVWPKLSMGVSGPLTAVLAGLSGSLLYGVSAVYTRKHLAGVEPMTVASGSTTIAALLGLPMGLVWLPAEVPSARAVVATVVLGVVCTGLAYVLFYRLFARIGAVRTVTVTFLIPVFGVLWGAVFLGEVVTWNMALGGALVLLGMSVMTGVASRVSGMLGRRAGALRSGARRSFDAHADD